MDCQRVGLIVNPIAGMGGRVGLKGTDGPRILARARQLGATPCASERAAATLRYMAGRCPGLDVFTCGGGMGQDAVTAAGLRPLVVYTPAAQTDAADTRAAAELIVRAGVDLLLFAGGDGTARDIYAAIGRDAACLGIPAGVKIHSPVYAASPVTAGEMAVRYLGGQTRELRDVEVVDLDESAYRAGQIAARLYGYLRVPFHQNMLQGAKARSQASERLTQRAIAVEIVDSLVEHCYYAVGPGTTTQAVLEHLGIEGTLLGVDLLRGRHLVARDVNEQELLRHVGNAPLKIIVTPVGGQGYLLGRGNQQFSPTVLRAAGPDSLIPIATPQKLHALCGRPLLVDTGESEIDDWLSGYRRVTTGRGEFMMYRVIGAAALVSL